MSNGDDRGWNLHQMQTIYYSSKFDVLLILLMFELLNYFLPLSCILFVCFCCVYDFVCFVIFVVCVCFLCLVFVSGLHSFECRCSLGSLDYSSYSQSQAQSLPMATFYTRNTLTVYKNLISLGLIYCS